MNSLEGLGGRSELEYSDTTRVGTNENIVCNTSAQISKRAHVCASSAFVPLAVASRVSVKLLDMLRESLNEATRRVLGEG